MGNSSFLSEYLVRIGFDVDMVGYSKYAAALRDAEGAVNLHTSSIAKSFLTWQTAAVGMFASVGAGVLGLVDKVVMGDQEFRLLGLRMYTTTSNARELKIAMDALGQPLENIAWDPELYRRFMQLVHDQQQMTKSLGPDFEKQMVQLRDYRFELTRLGVEAQYVSFKLVADLGKVFGLDLSSKFHDLKSFNDWLVSHIPKASKAIEKYLIPILKDTKDVLGETIDLFKSMGVAFTNLVGLISGDKSLEGSTASFDKFATAIQHSLDFLKEFVGGMIRVEESLSHVINAASMLADRNYHGAAAEIWKAWDVYSTPNKTEVQEQTDIDLQPMRTLDEQRAANRKLIDITARNMGVNPALALAVAQHESQFEQWDAAGKLLVNLGTPALPSHATGIFQLEPGAAKEMGVDSSTVAGNVTGGIRLLQTLLRKFHGDEVQALAGYYGSKDKAANLAFANDVIRRQHGFEGAGGGPVTMHNTYRVDVNVNVTKPGATAEEIGHVASKVVSDQMQKQTQRNLQEFTEQGYSY